MTSNTVANAAFFRASLIERFFGCGLPEGGFLGERMISPERVERRKEWRHSGFHAFAGEEIPDIPDALERIARLASHIPDRGTQLVHYYGAYSNAHRGIARRRESFVDVPPEDELSDPPRPESAWLAARRKSRARLIRRVYEADPLLCRCGEQMRVVGFITRPPVILEILRHIGRRFDPLILPGPTAKGRRMQRRAGARIGYRSATVRSSLERPRVYRRAARCAGS